MKPWPHQEHAHQQSRKLYGGGAPSWCVVGPCGSGKSLMMRRLALPAAENGKTVCIYTHRVMLTKQTVEAFESTGVEFGVIGAGFQKLENPKAKIQICSLPTVNARLDKSDFQLPAADLVIVDEAHQQVAGTAQKVFDEHDELGGVRIGFTATPVGIGGFYRHLVLAGNYTDMLDCKAHLPVTCYGPDRPDLSQLKPMKGGDFSSSDDKRVNYVPTIFGNVLKYYRIYNPNELPAIGFAPGVGYSKWFVEEFMRVGIACAHIDAERTVLVDKNANGKLAIHEYSTDEKTRAEVIEGGKDGRYKVIWNRFVLREAIDMPWLYHAILATSMGGLSTFLQTVGRVQRYWPEYERVIVQDHGGNLDRHGLPDENRNWQLGDSNRSIQQERKERIQQTKGDEAEPISCPQCCGMRTHGGECPHCGYMHKRSVRMVRQVDGELIKKVGRQIKYKTPKTSDDYMRSALFAAYQSGRTVAQAVYIAHDTAKKNGVDFKPTIKLPSRNDEDWSKSVREVYPWAKPKHMKG